MKLDGVPPGVAPSSEFHSHISHRDLDEPPDTPRRCGENRSHGSGGGGSSSWMPSPQQDLKHRDFTSPHDDRPPMSVVVVRGMPPLPYTPVSTSTPPERPGSHWEPAVARSNQFANGSNVSLQHAGSDQMKISVMSSFRLQPRTPTVTRSNRGGCRGRKRTAGGMLNLGSNASVPTTIRPGCAMTVNSQHPSDESVNASRTDLYPEVGLGLVGGCSHLTNTDVAVTPCSSEPRSPHVLDAALITLKSLSLRSPGGRSSPSVHDMNSPNSIKRPRGSSFSVYSSSPAGSLPSASSTRPSTTCNSARSSPRVVPLTVLMADSSCSSAHHHHQPPSSAVSNEIKTPSRPPFLGLKLPRDSSEKQHSQSRLLDKRSAAVSFESPLSSHGFGTSPSTPLPRITLTPRSSSTSRESSFPVFPSPACLDFDDEHRHHEKDDDDDDDDDGLPKFWLDGASPIIAPTPSSFVNKQASASFTLPQHHHFESMMPRASPRSERDTLVPPPPLKYPLAASSKFQHYGSSNSLALSADGSQDLNGPQPQQHHPLHMSPMDDTRPYTNSFLPFPHWLDSNHARSIRGIQESPGTPLSSDSVPGSTDLPTPQHSNSGKRPAFPFGIEEEEEPMFGIKSQSLLTGPSLLSAPRHLLVHPTMFEPEVNYSMDADTGSLSDSEDDEPFLLVSPKEIAEERLMAKRARLRRRWLGDSKPADAMGSQKLSMSSEGASNTSLFGMDIPQDESSSRLINPNSVSATSFPSHAEDASEPSCLSRRRSDGSLGSLGLSLEILSANTNPFNAITLPTGGCTGRDLVTPPMLPTSKATELSPPPFAPKQDPMLVFAEASLASRNNNTSCFIGRADRPSVVARIHAAADCEGPLYDGGVNDDEDETNDHHSMDED